MLYKVSILCAFLIFYTWPAQGEPGKCRDGVTKNKTPHQLLREDVFCSYDKESRPVTDFHKNITINLVLLVKFFYLDERKNALDVHAWLGTFWTDEILKWNPEDYSNIKILHVKSYEIWEPDISIHNGGNMEENGVPDFSYRQVNSTGRVVRMSPLKWSANCVANLQRWPFDQRECLLKVGSWSQTGEEIDLTLRVGRGVKNFSSNGEWELLKTRTRKKVLAYDNTTNSTYLAIEFGFCIERHADAYAATVIIPSLAIILLTLASYWLDPKMKNRVAVCCVSILCHCLYLQYLGRKLPVNGTMTPIIILLFRDSLIITIVALVLAVVVERLSSSATSVPIPAWLNKFVGIVLSQKAGQFLLLRKFDYKRADGTDLMENDQQLNEEKDNREWFILVTIINYLGFLISLITYFILYIALIPMY